ncbi:hypothetical protein LEP1GSC165_2571 [Leptospira santarosai str. CBC523]|nr:hypothetical protein LEP1GSC165_2571 [Leptospira santarosai str. CBC523]
MSYFFWDRKLYFYNVFLVLFSVYIETLFCVTLFFPCSTILRNPSVCLRYGSLF